MLCLENKESPLPKFVKPSKHYKDINYIYLGKYHIAYERLKYNNIIKIHYIDKMNNINPRLSRNNCSNELRDFLLSVLCGTQNIEDINSLNKIEKCYIIDLLDACHVDIGQNKYDKATEKNNTLSVLLGEYEAGNKNINQLHAFLNPTCRFRLELEMEMRAKIVRAFDDRMNKYTM